MKNETRDARKKQYWTRKLAEERGFHECARCAYFFSAHLDKYPCAGSFYRDSGVFVDYIPIANGEHAFGSLPPCEGFVPVKKKKKSEG